MAQSAPFEEFKILLIGDVRVGKTSFLTRYTRNVVNKNEPPTIGVDYSTKSLVLKDGTIVKAKIWDTAGSEKYKAITTAKSVGALLFYDLTDRLTFDHTLDWLNEIHEHTEDDITVMLIGNKQDLVQDNPDLRKVTESEAQSFADKFKLLYSETSAKTGHNVKEAFEFLVETIYEKQKQKKLEGGSNTDQDEEKIKSKILKNFNKDYSGNGPVEEKKSGDCC